MKAINSLFLIILILSIFSCKKDIGINEGTHAPDVEALYYWSDGRKIELQVDSTEFVVEIDSTTGSMPAIRKMSSSNPNRVKISRSQKLIISKDLISNNVLNIDGKKIDIKSISEIYKDKNTKYRHEGTIVVVPKENKDIASIISYTNGETEILRKSEYGYYVLRVKDIQKTLSIANDIYESGLVSLSHPDFILELKKNETPNDPFFPNQVYLYSPSGFHINIKDAWDIQPNNTNQITVAVLDDGVESHPEFTNSLLPGYTPVNSSSKGKPNPSDPYARHGQAVAGIIGAKKNNNQGIAGVADFVKILPVNIFYGNESTSNIADAINWARASGADIIHNSWTYETTSSIQIVSNAINNALASGRNNKGCIVIFSSGNYHQLWSGVAFPANMPNVISVGAIGENGIVSSYSSRGANLDLVAPSNSLTTPFFYTIDRVGALGYSSGDYTSDFGGTSAAAPQVSGVAALLLKQNYNLTTSQVKDILVSTARDLGPSGYDETYGHGLVNAYFAIKTVQNSNNIISGPSEVCSSAIYEIYSNGAVSLENASGIATLTSLGNNQWKVERIGSANGKVNIVSASGNQIFKKEIIIGTPPPSISGPDQIYGNGEYYYLVEKSDPNSTLTLSLPGGGRAPYDAEEIADGTIRIITYTVDSGANDYLLIIRATETNSCGISTTTQKRITLRGGGGAS